MYRWILILLTALSATASGQIFQHGGASGGGGADADSIKGKPISTASKTDNYILKWDAALDSIMWEADNGAGGGRADSLGFDTDGDGAADVWLSSTGVDGIGVLKTGNSILFTADNDTITVSITDSLLELKVANPFQDGFAWDTSPQSGLNVFGYGDTYPKFAVNPLDMDTCTYPIIARIGYRAMITGDSRTWLFVSDSIDTNPVGGDTLESQGIYSVMLYYGDGSSNNIDANLTQMAIHGMAQGRYAANDTGNYITGVQAIAYKEGQGHVVTLKGVSGVAQTSSADDYAGSSIGSMYGGYFDAQIRDSTAVSSGYGGYFNAPNLSGSGNEGTVVNSYGIYVDQSAVGSSVNWGIALHDDTLSEPSIAFIDSAENTYKLVHHDNSGGRFYFDDNLYVAGTFQATSNITAGGVGQIQGPYLQINSNYSAGDEDAIIYFNATDENLTWDYGTNRFSFSDSLTINGNLSVTDGISGDDITDGTIDSSEIGPDAIASWHVRADGIEESDINTYDIPNDGEIHTWRDATFQFEWQSLTEIGAVEVDGDTMSGQLGLEAGLWMKDGLIDSVNLIDTDTITVDNILAIGGKDFSSLNGDGLTASGGALTADLGTDIDSSEIVNGSITLDDIHQHGATSGQVIKWDGAAWNPASDNTSAGAGLIISEAGAGHQSSDSMDFIPPMSVAQSGDALSTISVLYDGSTIDTNGSGQIEVGIVADANVPNNITIDYADSTDITNFDTDDLTQGSSNLYNQNIKADTAGDGTSVATITQPMILSEGSNITLTVINGDTVEIAGPASSSTADSMGVDTDGNGTVDNYLYSTIAGAMHLKQGDQMVLTVAGDTVTIAGFSTTAGLETVGGASYGIADNGVTGAKIFNQTITEADIDTTNTDYVVGGIYKITSAVAGSLYVTQGNVDASFQPLEATLTDIADGTIAENLVNTTNPWADNEIATSGNWNTAYGWGDHSTQNYLDDDVADDVDDLDIDWGSGATQVDLADIPGGTAGASAFDFGGATSFELPNGTAPVTNAEGEIAWDNNDDAIEVYSGDEAESALIPIYKHISIPIVLPDSVQAYVPDLKVFTVNSLLYPAGIEIDLVAITLEGDAAYSMVIEEWSSADPAVYQNAISTVTTGASDTYAEEAPDTDGTLDAGDVIVLDIPTTDVDVVTVEIYFHVTAN